MMNAKIFFCKNCLYLFEAGCKEQPDQCPDCGKGPVVEANETQKEEYFKNRELNEI